MEATFVECKGCKKHWYNGIGLEMCDNDWNCLEHEIRHRTKDVCTITWHPYPQEVPPRYDEYLVTASNDLMERTRFIDLWHYCKNDEFQKLGYMLPPEAHVLAWAEKPNAYLRRK